jgi:hypothetical protein
MLLDEVDNKPKRRASLAIFLFEFSVVQPRRIFVQILQENSQCNNITTVTS